MSHYGILLPGYWDGSTGRAIAEAGGVAAQLVGLYFTSNPDATMIGLYPAKLLTVRDRIGTLNTKALERAIAALSVAGFAEYDLGTEIVWVREMAKFRLGLHHKPIKKDDNRATGAIRLYERVIPNPFLAPFFKRYRTDLHLPKPRAFKGEWKRIGSPLQAPSKPVTGTDLSIQGTGIRSQKEQQEGQEQRAAARDSHRVLVKFAHEALETPDASTVSDGELCARIKDKAAPALIPYDGRACQKALDAARATHAKRSA